MTLPAGVSSGITATRTLPLPLKRGRPRVADRLFGSGVTVAGALVLVVIGAMIIFLVVEGLPAMQHYGFFSFVAAARWAPSEAFPNVSHPNPYGILQFIYGTMLTSIIGMLIAVPLAVGAALVITDIAPQRVKGPLSALVDLLAAVPSVVYGFWGIFALIPAIKPVVDFLTTTLGTVPVIGVAFQGPFFGVLIFHGRVGLGDHGATDHRSSVSRGLPEHSPKRERSSAGSRRHSLGDAADRGPAASTLGHRRSSTPRSRKGARRDHRRDDGDW